MNFGEVIQELFAFDANLRQEVLRFCLRFGGFIALIIIARIAAQIIPGILRRLVERFAPELIVTGYQQVMVPIRSAIVNAAFLILTAVSLGIIGQYRALYGVLNFFIYLALSVAVAWLLSRLVSEIIRIYGVKIFQQLSRDVDDFVLVIESLANAIIVFFAIIYFAQSQNLNLISVLAGLGIAGLALSFAAKETIAQVIGSIVLYLDRPYLPGEYVRVSFNPKAEDVYGRIESIGIRSTKIRVAVKNTLIVAPNSVMVAKDIENISRGNKVMALLYLDFPSRLPEQERALVKQVVEEAISSIFGVEPLSTRVAIFDPDDRPGSRARTSFFLLSSTRGALNLRKRLVDVANQKISRRFAAHGLEFVIQEPLLYVDSPITR